MNVFEQELTNAKANNFNRLKNEILLNEIKKLKENSLNEAIQLKYNQVSDFISLSSMVNIPETVEQLEKVQDEMNQKRSQLILKVTDYVKTALELLDVTWSIIEEYKFKSEKDKNEDLDHYYTTLVDTLLISIKILHLKVLLDTYEDEEMRTALVSLKNILEKEYMAAERRLKYTSQRIEEYNKLGPEFEILTNAYHRLIYRVQATKDDIERIKNN
ncbi:uncharacterized protein BX663DRAFT_553585 [Cokeromyces recurvatus]|uniref:uncharacterized protein n=1 Tax=Cokeromyces recurvatus TaxID=90255 RepID=UPI0022210B68|nr:uncharacterized protein BX663DRAFT_553585 [Cokeromyces recurvatus]KAI7900940.1 hypothetical protein BX663DRAFT_553585 [Cokeromyces recurvatus]